jgi:TolB-like protein
MDVLVHLAANPGRVVSKEELLAAVWGGVFVEEGALSQAIHSIRKALGDDARQPRYVQTVPKRGYRLVAPVEPEPGSVKALAEVVPASLPESPAPSPVPAFRWSRRARLLMGMAGILVSLVLWVVWTHRGRPDLQANDGIRIIVLPFGNLGEPEDPYFAAGLTEEITANLTLLPTMQVIPGRNALGDKDVTKPPLEIGEELKVDYVLVGVVDWSVGPRQVRVRPQLIRMTDKIIVFGDPFEESRGDLFRAQQEISRAVISTLDITLTPEQSRAVGERSTRNPEAYRAYVQGLVLKDQPFYSPPHLAKAVMMFEQAVDTDPGFAEAWAELSQAHSYLAFNTDRSSKRKEQARRAMERAVALGPDLLATQLAQAYFSYR